MTLIMFGKHWLVCMNCAKSIAINGNKERDSCFKLFFFGKMNVVCAFESFQRLGRRRKFQI